MDRKLATISITAFFAILCLAGAAAADDTDAGKTAYESNCASCHGMTGKGDGPVSAAINPKPRDFSTGEFKFDADKSGAPGDDADLKLVIQKGAMAYGGSPMMAGWPTFSDEEIGEIIAHMRTLKE
jgi:mono/diheme cytochrome c family protein